MINLFISIGFFDILDILIVAGLFYVLYMLMRGTIAINIFVGILIIYFFWQIVTALKMDLLNTIIGQFIGVGFIALIVVFQQEIRRFLLVLGTRDFLKRKSVFDIFLTKTTMKYQHNDVDSIVFACSNMAATKTGALIVMSDYSPIKTVILSGDVIDAVLSSRLLENIFFKNSPLHDGAVIIQDAKIVAARCILPITKSTNVPASMGMRHRAAIGITEEANTLVVVVSEETGNISAFKPGQEYIGIDSSKLRNLIAGYFKLSDE